MTSPRVLLLGGTTEASMLARKLAETGVDAVFSYAGRTNAPVGQPLPTRVGGFGGVVGLVNYIRTAGITHVVDATHPFAAGMTSNAIAACAETKTPLIGLERAPWVAGEGDIWVHVPDTEAAIAALPDAPARVFLAIGKQTLSAFAAKRQHHYLLRLVDAPEGALPLPDCAVVIDRGPFDVAGDRALMQTHRISHIVAKNAGGVGANAKLVAARDLHLPVILIDRPRVPARLVVDQVQAVLDWLHQPRPLAERGV